MDISQVSSELGEIFLNRSGEVALVEITYPNGGKVTGTVEKVRQGGRPLMSPRKSASNTRPPRLKVTIRKTILEKGERPVHRVAFDHAVTLEVFFRNGSSAKFP